VASFTLIELLTVIAIIAILAALTLAAASAVMKTAGRNRARSEIAAMTTALENYKSDNGIYPQADYFPQGTNGYIAAVPTTAGGYYQLSSELLYQSLTGQTNYGDIPPKASSGTKIYMTFTKSQLGNNTAGAGGPIYIQDPFGNSYGYSTGTNNAGTYSDIPFNGAGLFDLWSSGGDLSGTTTGTNVWLNNWSGS